MHIKSYKDGKRSVEGLYEIIFDLKKFMNQSRFMKVNYGYNNSLGKHSFLKYKINVYFVSNFLRRGQ